MANRRDNAACRQTRRSGKLRGRQAATGRTGQTTMATVAQRLRPGTHDAALVLLWKTGDALARAVPRRAANAQRLRHVFPFKFIVRAYAGVLHAPWRCSIVARDERSVVLRALLCLRVYTLPSRWRTLARAVVSLRSGGISHTLNTFWGVARRLAGVSPRVWHGAHGGWMGGRRGKSSHANHSQPLSLALPPFLRRCAAALHRRTPCLLGRKTEHFASCIRFSLRGATTLHCRTRVRRANSGRWKDALAFYGRARALR